MNEDGDEGGPEDAAEDDVVDHVGDGVGEVVGVSEWGDPKHVDQGENPEDAGGA